MLVPSLLRINVGGWYGELNTCYYFYTGDYRSSVLPIFYIILYPSTPR